MPTINSTVHQPHPISETQLTTPPQVFHAYAYGTAFWYFLRGLCRIYDPTMVVGWFRPPIQSHFTPNDLELYNVRNDGWCLITLALILIGFTNAVPGQGTSKSQGALPYAKAVVAATVFHHVTTGIGAYQHYKLDSHYNTSMAIGVWANVWLTISGAVTLASLVSGEGERRVEDVSEQVHKKVR
jgi:mannan endo-1,6-alpha-mannosidase